MRAIAAVVEGCSSLCAWASTVGRNCLSIRLVLVLVLVLVAPLQPPLKQPLLRNERSNRSFYPSCASSSRISPSTPTLNLTSTLSFRLPSQTNSSRTSTRCCCCSTCLRSYSEAPDVASRHASSSLSRIGNFAPLAVAAGVAATGLAASKFFSLYLAFAGSGCCVSSTSPFSACWFVLAAAS